MTQTEALQQMVSLLSELLPEPSVVADPVKGVRLFRVDTSFARTPKSCEPQIILMAQGKKTLYLGDETYTYDPSRYVVLSVPLPVECEATALPGKPAMGLTIQVDPSPVGEILMEMKDTARSTHLTTRGIFSSEISEELIQAAVRLLQTMKTPADAKILGPMIVKEIIYRVLCGEHGHALRSLAI